MRISPGRTTFPILGQTWAQKRHPPQQIRKEKRRKRLVKMYAKTQPAAKAKSIFTDLQLIRGLFQLLEMTS